MEATAPVEDSFYIVATESTADHATRVLKDGDTFAVFDQHGDIQAETRTGQEGVYHEGTRFLSHLLFKLGNARPFLLNSTVQEDNLAFVVNLTNPDIYRSGHLLLARGSLHITRSKLLRQSTCFETFRFINYGLAPVEARFSIQFGADFADIFEVRGMTRQSRGSFREEQNGAEQIAFAYRGLDGVMRRTIVQCDPAPDSLTVASATFLQTLGPKQEREFTLTYSCEIEGTTPVFIGSTYDRSHAEAERDLSRHQSQEAQVSTSNEQFNDWLARSSADLHMMFTSTPYGLYPYAGVPWFSTPFGRDGIITALEYLWINPKIARGVLSYLAATQARREDPERDAQPGKILHETRKGEMAALREVPFDRYYGSVDATPLFVVLAGAYFETTQDVEFIKSIWPQINLALRWIDHYGDSDGDGFVEYARSSPKGLIHQGWKDSWDSVSHSDGVLAQGPIALCEVQGYAYAARIAGAAIATVLARRKRARTLMARAEALKEKFQTEFWCDDLSSYALALDGNKQQCRVVSSNPGHCLWSGIADDDNAKTVAHVLMQDNSFSGWGVRTLAFSEARFNPMSYHNGSVWPHDNSLIAAGLSRYGFKDEACRILGSLFDASIFVEYRLPELFCGFYRRKGAGPVPYPTACSPQAWSAAAVFLLLQSILGMSINAARSRLSFVQPVLPSFLDEVRINNLRVGAASVDVLISRRAQYATVQVERREGRVELFTEA
jgi:glycogen debranching enzyme